MSVRRGVAALVVAVGAAGALLSGVPAGVAPVRAADYRLSTQATYAVHPDDREVGVTVAISFRNTTPDPPGRFSVFEVVDLAIHTGARDVRAADHRGKLHVSVSRRHGVTVASVRPRRGVRYGATSHFTLRYSLPDAASRDVRIRPSVVTFPVWSFGTDGSVEVRLPVDYQVLVDGDALRAARSGGSWQLTSGRVADPAHWLSLLTATLPSTFVSSERSVQLANGPLQVKVRAWSDDRRWGRDTLELAVRALPRMERAAGFELPPQGPLVIVESLPAAGGALSEPGSSGADLAVGFDESSFTLLHQLAHAWFTPQLAGDRWIREGFASRAAATVARQLHVRAPYQPGAEARDRGHDSFPLVSWGAGKSSAAQDRYAFAASWSVASQLARLVGPDALGLAWRRSAGGLNAYEPLDAKPVAGTAARPVDSRSLLDQLEVVSPGKAGDLTAIFSDSVFDAATRQLLTARASARQQYRELADASDGAVPNPVRLAMAGWRFEDAEAAIAEARDWLQDGDRLEADAAAAGLTLPQRLRDAYLTGGGTSAARGELDAEAAVVRDFAQASARLEQPRSAVEQAGLLGGQDPQAMLGEARTAFAEGDLVGAASLASDALDRLQDAGRDGLVRLASAAAVLLALLIGVVWLVRRRRQRRVDGYTAGP